MKKVSFVLGFFICFFKLRCMLYMFVWTCLYVYLPMQARDGIGITGTGVTRQVWAAWCGSLLEQQTLLTTEPPQPPPLETFTLVTFLLLWRDAMTKAAHREESLFGAHSFRGLECRSVAAGSVAGRHACCQSSSWELTSGGISLEEETHWKWCGLLKPQSPPAVTHLWQGQT